MSPLIRSRLFPYASVVLVLAVALAMVVVSLSAGKELDARHRRTDFAESFDFANGTYADYLAYSERLLRAAHPDATPGLISNLAPFRLEPDAEKCRRADSGNFRNGVLLTHDVLETSYTMRELANYFQSRCFLVYGLLLPGHGTRPGDLLRTQWREWAAAENFAARELAREAENVFLGGHGIGGTLAIFEASQNAGVDGLVLFAPDLATHDVETGKAFASAALGWLAPALRWEEVLPAASQYRYDSWPYRLNGQVNALIDATHEALPTRPFEVPVFMVASQDDVSVSTPAILDYMAERIHPLSHTLLYTRDPVPARLALTMHLSYFPEQVHVLSLSHAGLMLPQGDPVFGYNASDRNCGHYYLHRKDQAAYEQCMAGERDFLGEITPENLEEGVVERIAHNPFFYLMLVPLDTFISPVTSVPPPPAGR